MENRSSTTILNMKFYLKITQMSESIKILYFSVCFCPKKNVKTAEPIGPKFLKITQMTQPRGSLCINLVEQLK